MARLPSYRMNEQTGEEEVEIGERQNQVFTALEAIKGILNHGITTLDEKRDSYFMKVGERPNYPFGANYIILPNNPKSMREAEYPIPELDERLKKMADENPEEDRAKYAVMYAVFPYE